MTRTIDAVYEGGVLRPLQLQDGIAEHARVRLTLETVGSATGGMADCVGTLPDDDAAEMRRIVHDQFEQVNPGEW
ncbi:MAG: antitoxin family protein [Phycisphaerales bacterium]|nr:antitoxin family protein [Phycisphaerales bacterium]